SSPIPSAKWKRSTKPPIRKFVSQIDNVHARAAHEGSATTSRVHADRAAGGDRHHRGADRPAPAGRAKSPRSLPADSVSKPTQANDAGGPQLPNDSRLLSERR